MKKQNKDVRNIYWTAEALPEPAPARQLSEMIECGIRKQRIFNVFVGLLIIVLVVTLIAAVFFDYSPMPRETAPAGKKASVIAFYTLPTDELWVIEYSQVAYKADSSGLSGPKPLSSKWVKNAAYHIIMGEQALRLNDADGAQNHLEAVIDAFPGVAGVCGHLGTVYLKKQLFAQAADLLQKALEEQPSVAVLHNLGVAYLGVGDYAQAEPLLLRALEQQPALAGGYKNLALLYQKTERTNEAVTAFEKYLSLNPRDTQQLDVYVSYLNSAGRSRDAAAFLEQIKGADPLVVNLRLAKIAAQDNNAGLAVRALRDAARFCTPRQTIEEMHDAVFDNIAGTEPFEELVYQLELAAVSLSTNLNTSAGAGR